VYARCDSSGSIRVPQTESPGQENQVGKRFF
jgi:hypothetical protein